MGSHIANSPWGLQNIWERFVSPVSDNSILNIEPDWHRRRRLNLPLRNGVRSYPRKSVPLAPYRSSRGYATRPYQRRVKYPAPAEMKFFDTALSFSFDATAEVPNSGQLCLVPQGATQSTRVGRKITIKSLEIKGSIGSGSGNKASCDITHLYVVLDKQCNGAAATYADVFDTTLNAASTGTHMRNMANIGRFVVLKHFISKIQPVTGGAVAETAEGADFTYVQFFKKMNLPVEYSGNSAPVPEVITNIRSNNIFLLAMSANLATGDDDNSTFLGTCRIRYTDS